ncbi:MAG: hypothetical protein HY785_05900 [Oscillatoriophycideae cyanobacterium NC_groundwater_1537_Pr4_S-0.65um_50_18]|nr:hypothetical protein [Oscillatoriophycideae cyanobacterium NC_groundwater_1537_Pr4_S-0.65um_50_18]
MALYTFYAEEDQALQKAIANWEQQSHTKVELSLFSSDDILNQAVIALENGAPPDILFAHRADYTPLTLKFMISLLETIIASILSKRHKFGSIANAFSNRKPSNNCSKKP